MKSEEDYRVGFVEYDIEYDIVHGRWLPARCHFSNFGVLLKIGNHHWDSHIQQEKLSQTKFSRTNLKLNEMFNTMFTSTFPQYLTTSG